MYRTSLVPRLRGNEASIGPEVASKMHNLLYFEVGASLEVYAARNPVLFCSGSLGIMGLVVPSYTCTQYSTGWVSQSGYLVCEILYNSVNCTCT